MSVHTSTQPQFSWTQQPTQAHSRVTSQALTAPTPAISQSMVLVPRHATTYAGRHQSAQKRALLYRCTPLITVLLAMIPASLLVVTVFMLWAFSLIAL